MTAAPLPSAALDWPLSWPDDISISTTPSAPEPALVSRHRMSEPSRQADSTKPQMPSVPARLRPPVSNCSLTGATEPALTQPHQVSESRPEKKRPNPLAHAGSSRRASPFTKKIRQSATCPFDPCLSQQSGTLTSNALLIRRVAAGHGNPVDRLASSITLSHCAKLFPGVSHVSPPSVASTTLTSPMAFVPYSKSFDTLPRLVEADSNDPFAAQFAANETGNRPLQLFPGRSHSQHSSDSLSSLSRPSLVDRTSNGLERSRRQSADGWRPLHRRNRSTASVSTLDSDNAADTTLTSRPPSRSPSKAQLHAAAMAAMAQGEHQGSVDTASVHRMLVRRELDGQHVPEVAVGVSGRATNAATCALMDVSSNSKAKIFPCTWPGCVEIFKRREHVNRHMRMHTDERPFQCEIPGCEKTFTRSDNCAAHMRLHEKQALQQQQPAFTDLAQPAPRRLEPRRSSSSRTSIFEPSPASSIRSSPSMPSPVLPYTPPLHYQFSMMAVAPDHRFGYPSASPVFDPLSTFSSPVPPALPQLDPQAVPVMSPVPMLTNSLDWQPYPSPYVQYLPQVIMPPPMCANGILSHDPSDFISSASLAA